jgi:hypothetical protein
VAVALFSCDHESLAPNFDDPIEIVLEPVVDGFDRPILLTAPPGDFDRLFVVEQGG